MTHLKLSARFTLILTIVFLLGILAGGVALWRVLQQRAQDEFTKQGLLLIETMNSVRTYTTEHVRPLLADQIYENAEFVPETVPAFSARAVFEGFQKQQDFQTFFYKEASLNPTNPRNLADTFENELLTGMYTAGAGQEESGFRDLAGRQVFYIARSMVIGSESCLECHSTPEVAPASLIATYGTDNGFGWKLGEVVAVQMIYVPAQEVLENARQSFSLVMTIFVITFALIIWLINTLLNRYVIQPVDVLNDLAYKISTDEDISADLAREDLKAIVVRSDELGSLAKVFKEMATEVYARTEKLKQQVQRLSIEIDEIRRKEQVSEVVETEFFNDLQEQARKIRQRRQDREEKSE